MQRLLVPLFTFVWWNRLVRDKFGRDHVYKVKGWRTALMDGYGGKRSTVTFMFGKSKIVPFK
jgi:hypothetical protein